MMRIIIIFIIMGVAKAEFISFKDQLIYSNTSVFDERVSELFDNETDAFETIAYCGRPCDGIPKKCMITLNIEHYQAMGVACQNCTRGNSSHCSHPQCIAADGVEKGIVTINRNFPGPLIEVCVNDLVTVKVVNSMHSDSTTIHWHGILQRDSPYMDGVPFITQCPILPGNSFTYTFLTAEHGTYFYHSHSGFQRYAGMYGGLIVRQPKYLDSVRTTYDVDKHVVVLSDWSHDVPEMFNVGLPTRRPGFDPDNLLVNGKGKYFDPITNIPTGTPYEIFYVTRGLRHRFRIINAGSSVCPMEVQIEGHDMMIIASDGDNVRPRRIDTLHLTTGERFDIVINAIQTPKLYWLYVRAIGECAGRNIVQRAIISYLPTAGNNQFPTSSLSPPNNPLFTTLNDLEADCGANNPLRLCIKDLQYSGNFFKYPNPHFTKYLAFEMQDLDPLDIFAAGSNKRFMNPFNDSLLTGTMNNISMGSVPYPILSQYDQIPASAVCDPDINNLPASCSRNKVCTCPHVFSMPQNIILDLVLIDTTPIRIPIYHPIHLHGYKFEVIAQGRVPLNTPPTIDYVRNLKNSGKLNGNNPYPPRKDNIAIQNQGWALIRIHTNNPGAWFIHCHVEDHAIFGMASVMVVSGFIPGVPRNFPRCGNF